MAIVYPYPLPMLADRLAIASVVWDIQRNDEMSGSGDGRVWQAELAQPLWTADVVLSDDPHNDVKQIAALIRRLHGSQESFMLYDPLSMYPQADPKGTALGANVVHNRGDGAHLNREMKHDAHDAFNVVPAKAGTHITRFSGDKGKRRSARARTTMVQGVWVPAGACHPAGEAGPVGGDDRREMRE